MFAFVNPKNASSREVNNVPIRRYGANTQLAGRILERHKSHDFTFSRQRAA